MQFSADDPVLKMRLRELEAILQHSRELVRHGRPANPANIHQTGDNIVKELGGALFNALLSGDGLILYEVGRFQMHEATSLGLRLRLLVRPPELMSLPWESLYDTKCA
jgi:hypothetical protein